MFSTQRTIDRYPLSFGYHMLEAHSETLRAFIFVFFFCLRIIINHSEVKDLEMKIMPTNF